MKEIIELIRELAGAAGYSPAEIRAGLEHADRKARRAHPPGDWGNAKCFYPSERTEAVESCRPPSRARPFTEMRTARTAAHCAEVFGAEVLLAVRRVARARALADAAPRGGTAHEWLALRKAMRRALRPVKR